jgi:uncharacterized membrane protein YkoI
VKIKTIIGSTMALGLLGIGVLAGSVVGAGQAAAQTPVTTPSAAATAVPAQPALPSQPAQPAKPAQPTTATVTQAAAEQTALATSPGNTVDHSSLITQNGVSVWDVDFANGGGVTVNAETGAVIATEAAGADQGGGGKGGRGGHGGGADNQAALLAQAKVTQADAEKTALATSPSSTIDHSRLDNRSGTLVWDIDFADGGGVTVDAQTGAVISTEAAGTDQGGRGFKNAPSASATTTP